MVVKDWLRSVRSRSRSHRGCVPRRRECRRWVAANIEPLEVRLALTPTTVAPDGFGNLVITDTDGNTNDQLTIQSDAINQVFVISDPVNLPMTTIPFSAVSGKIIVNTLDGDDSLTVDFSLGDFKNAINFDGGAQSISDSLMLIGREGQSFAMVTHRFKDASA